MSSPNKLSLLASALACASTVLASPYAAGYKHAHVHRNLHLPGPPVPYPYPGKNTTAILAPTTPPTSSTPAAGPAAPSYSQSPPDQSPDVSPDQTATTFAPQIVTTFGLQTVTTFSTQTRTVTVFRTLPSPSGSAGAGEVSPAVVQPNNQCPLDATVTVTATEKVYVTVTAAQPASSSPSADQPHSNSPSAGQPPSSSPSAGQPPSSPPSSPASAAAASSVHPADSPPSSASSASASWLPAFSAPPPYSSVNHTISAVAPISPTHSAVSTEGGSAPSSSPTSSPLAGGKRGLAYNAADLTTCFDDSKEITWAYNWVSASAGLTGNLQFIPTLHDGSDTFTSVWEAEASASLASGSKTLFSFNEPDHSSQANMSPEVAAQAYIKYMNPFAGQAQLCAPSVTNGPGEMGLTWLQNFLDACAGNCHIDCYNIHWYNPADSAEFKSHVDRAIQIAGDKPLWVSEFGCNGASDDQVTSFLQDVMPWMDANDSIAGYAYFMVSDGSLLSGTEPSPFGQTYKTFT